MRQCLVGSLAVNGVTIWIVHGSPCIRGSCHHAHSVFGVHRLQFLEGQKLYRLREVRWRMHHLEDARHALGSVFLDLLSLHLRLGDLGLLVTLLDLLVRDEVLRHDPANLFKVLKNG